MPVFPNNEIPTMGEWGQLLSARLPPVPTTSGGTGTSGASLAANTSGEIHIPLGSVSGMTNKALILAVNVTSDPANKSTNYDFQIYQSSGKADADLGYSNLNVNHYFRDNVVGQSRYQDTDMTGSVHILINNKTANASFYTINIIYWPSPARQSNALE